VRRAARVAGRLARLALSSTRPPPTPRRVPLVSVITATYNWSSVLRFAIESVRGQTYPNWELLVVGDGCTDDSEEVVRSFGDPRIRWTNLPANSGSQSAPNNAGLELARGEYVAYHGHDDLWLPGHLASLVDGLQRTGAGIASTAFQTLGPPGSNVREIAYLLRTTEFARRSTPSSVMHRRECAAAVGGWRDYRELVEPPDRDLIGRVAAAYGSAFVPVLTVWKLNSAMRRNSYVERRSDEQAALAARMRRERLFTLRELAAFASLQLRRPEPHLPEMPAPPAEVPPGWWVTEWRRIRGLEPPC